jgi:predicted metal-dependent hydrolase
MSDLTVRRLMIDLSSGFPRDWYQGDAFRTAVFNALSMSFPVGEQFFIDSVKAGVAALPEEQRGRFADDLAGFVGQEATHRHIHGLFNAQLEKQGYTNTWQERARRRTAVIQKLDARHQVAITAAFEHYTAILADWLLANQADMTGVDQRLRNMWLWHSVEESEHKSVAFDVYQALSGSTAWRIRWFMRASFFFSTDLMRQTLRNLAHDRALFKWSTWRSGASFLFGKKGMIRAMWQPLRAYLADDFHPTKLDSTRLTSQWLASNADTFKVVRAAA